MAVNIKDALELVNDQEFGVLSTQSLELEGYPFGSITPYCLDENNNPIIYISTIAQHSKNINANHKTCLTIFEAANKEGQQTKGRISIISDAIKIQRDEQEFDTVSKEYFLKFPESKKYLEFHDFFFYRLDIKKVRYIAGFGKIMWIEKNKWNEIKK